MHRFIIFLSFYLLSVSVFSNDSTLTPPLIDNLEQLPKTPHSSAIVLKGDTLFKIYKTLDNSNVIKRADKINDKLANIAPHFNPILDSTKLIKDDDIYLLMINKEIIMTLYESDATIEDELFIDFCKLRRQDIVDGLKDYRFHLSRDEWIKRIINTVITFIGLIVFLIIVRLVFNRLDKKLSKYERKFLARKRNLLRYFIPKDTKNIFVFLSKIGRFIITATFLITFIPLMFSFLPWTQGIVEVFYTYLKYPVSYILNGIMDFIPHLIFILVILFITRYIVRVLKYFAEDIDSEKLVIKGFPKDWATPTVKLLSVIIYAFSIVMIFPHLPGSDSPAFKGVSIFLGVLFSLGSTSAIANIIAGIVITYMRPYKIGDRVNIMGTEGDVVERTMLVTRIKTPKNIEVTIPNATIINNHLVNYSANAEEESIVISIDVSIGYDITWEKVNKLLLRAARKTKMIKKEPVPFIFQRELADNYVVYSLNVFTKEVTKMALLRSDLFKNTLDIFNKEGIEILSPKYVASRDGNLSTLPSHATQDFRHPIEKVIDAIKGKDKDITSDTKQDATDNKEE